MKDKLDFRNSAKQLMESYLYRILALLLFSGLFYVFVNYVHGETCFRSLVNIKVEGIPGIVSVILLIAVLVFVLGMHELIHAGVYFVTKGQKPKIGINGFVIYAAAPTQVVSRSEILANSMAPFAIISIVGLVAMAFISTTIVSWVFIPTLANAAASGGDFTVILFVLKQKQSSQFNDAGDIIYVLNRRNKRSDLS